MDWIDATARQFERHDERFPTPGAIAEHIDPRTVRTPALDIIDQSLVELADTPDGRLIITMPPQEGKALALDTPIATPTGWATMGELRVGDQVFGGDGKPCAVTWVSPVWHGHDCYAVTTGDGERIVANASHEWVARLDRRSSARIVTTKVLAKPRSKAAQIRTAALHLPDADLPLDPYTLGIWLGDGTTGQATITSHPDDTHVRDRIAAAGWPMRHLGRMRWTMSPPAPNGTFGRGNPSPAKAALRATGALHSKHVPATYLRASASQRLALLQGLIDSDGHVLSKGQVEFCSTSHRLAMDVQHLAASLGSKATLSVGRATIDGRDCGPKYRVRFYLEHAASLPRKASRCKDSSAAGVRYVRAERVESVPTVCIEVDSPDHTYLAGRTLLMTRNSTRVARDFVLWALRHNPDTRVVVGSYAQGLANRNGRTVRNAIASNPDLNLRIAPDHGAASEWSLAGHHGGVLAVGRGAGVTGRPADLLIIDDPIKDRAEADSETIRTTCWDWWTESLSTRLAPGAPVVLILTRWHQEDLAGRLLAAPDGHLWRVVNIPAQADHRPERGEADLLDRAPGEYMLSARGRSPAQWEAIKTRVGSRTWAALYQGRPSPAGGDLFARDGWARYAEPLWVERDDGSRIVPGVIGADVELVQSWDMAFKDTKGSDYVVGQVWLRRGPNAYLLDQVRGRWGFSATCDKVRALSARWPQAVAKLVEDKANGPAVINALRATIGGFIAVEPEGSKYARASAVTPFVEADNVVLPEPALAPWVDDLIEEAAGFPNAANDDQVDALSQAAHRLLLVPILSESTLTADELLDEDLDLEWATSAY